MRHGFILTAAIWGLLTAPPLLAEEGLYQSTGIFCPMTKAQVDAVADHFMAGATLSEAISIESFKGGAEMYPEAARKGILTSTIICHNLGDSMFGAPKSRILFIMERGESVVKNVTRGGKGRYFNARQVRIVGLAINDETSVFIVNPPTEEWWIGVYPE